MNDIQKAVIKTLVYFDLYDYPLTLAELYRYLWKAPNVQLAELEEQVNKLPEVEQFYGLYCLKGRKRIIHNRRQHYLESEKKFSKRLPYIKLLSYLPYVQAIFIVNSLAIQNVNEESDVDLLIITKPKKIWSTRFFTTTVAKLLGIRPKPNNAKDALCLSFYMDETDLNFKKIMNGPDDICEIYWIKQLFPIYDPNKISNKIEYINSWVSESLPKATAMSSHPQRVVKHTWLHTLIQTILGIIAIEPLWKKIQLAIMPNNLKSLSSSSSQAVVVLSDTLLKFHTYNPKIKQKQRWLEAVKHYLQ